MSDIKVMKRSNVTVLHNSKGFKIFDNKTQEELFVWIGKYLFRGSYIVLEKYTNKSTKYEAAISYRGEFLVPFELEATHLYIVQKSRTAFFVELKDKKGCYFSNTKQFIEGVRVRKDKSRFYGAYEIYAKDRWNKYVIRNGKYVPVRWEKICYYS